MPAYFTLVIPLLGTPYFAAAFEGHFRPTMVTDESGALADDLAEDLSV